MLLHQHKCGQMVVCASTSTLKSVQTHSVIYVCGIAAAQNVNYGLISEHDVNLKL